MRELTAEEVRKRVNPEELEILNPEETKGAPIILGNEGIVETAAMAYHIKAKDYHIALVVPDGVDGFDLAEKLARRIADKNPDLLDYCFVFDYKQPSEPQLIEPPAGTGQKLANDVDELIKKSLCALSQFDERPFWEDDYEDKNKLVQKFNNTLKKRGSRYRFHMDISPEGQPIYNTSYVNEQGQEIPIIQLMKMAPPGPEKDQILNGLDALKDEIQGKIHELHNISKKTIEKIARAKKNIIKEPLDKLREAYQQHQAVLNYFNLLEEDIITTHLPLFDFTGIDRKTCAPCRQGITEVCEMHSRYGYFSRFAVTVLVDNSQQKEVPIIKVVRATCSELFGLKTESQGKHETYRHTGMKPGAFHRANQGFLVIEATKLLQKPAVLEAFTATLDTMEIRIEDLMKILGFSERSVSLNPENIKLDLKVILILNEGLYQILQGAKEWVGLIKFFKTKVTVKSDMPHTPENVKDFQRFAIACCQENGLRQPDLGAQARLIEYGLELIDHQEKLSLKTEYFLDIMREANDFAKINNHSILQKEDIEQAINAKEAQHSDCQQRMLELFGKNILLMETEGKKVGQANGLVIMVQNDYKGGLPNRHTATASVGKEGIVDIEGTVGLAGPIHKKATLILTGLLKNRFARNKLLALDANLCVEQSYGPREGDSASITQFVTLLSAIAEVPLRQNLAMTGSLDHCGEVQPVGGVSEKIRGFYEVCKLKGRNDEQGVIIPVANIENLMLKSEIVKAVEDKTFHIYPVRKIEEVIELLTDMEAGEPQPDGTYPEGTFFQKVDDKLLKMIKAARDSVKGGEEKDKKD